MNILSTMAYEETAETPGVIDEQRRAAIQPGRAPVVSKGMAAVVAHVA